MKFSKNWLQEYIVEKLPSDEVISETLNKKAFEVEEMVEVEGDTIFDIKVLPNRIHDALGHHGMAYELCGCFGFTFKEDVRNTLVELFEKEVALPSVAIDDDFACTRFMSVRIDGVSVNTSPEWLKERLQSVGQRSINAVVDITNYVQFALNKPMHAYDARGIQGTLRARFAKSGESLTTLDDKVLMLDKDTLVIADDEKVLGLAGIKGGKYSGIQSDTTSIIIESANFLPSLIRKTSEKYNIKTDASKRFENGIANALILEGLYMTINMIKELFPSAKVSFVVDVYPKMDVPYYVGISRNEINAILGAEYSKDEIVSTLQRLSFPYETIVPYEYMMETYPTLPGAVHKYPSVAEKDAPHAFSCMSLLSYLYKGTWLPAHSVDAYVYSSKIEKNDLAFGDIVFLNSGNGHANYESIDFLRGTKVLDGIDHAGMYVGDGKVIHATPKEGLVVVETLEKFENSGKIVGYGRVAYDLYEERYVVRVPSVRLDIRIKENLAEEIGRIIGYEKLTPTLPNLSRDGMIEARAYYQNKIKSILASRGFSEVMTYTFGDVGDVSLVKGLALDKEKLRTSLTPGILKSVALNLYNAPLLGTNTIKMFEFGNVFRAGLQSDSNSGVVCSESMHMALTIENGEKKSNFISEVGEILEEIKRSSNAKEVHYEITSTKPYVIEIDFDTLIESLPLPSTYEAPSFATLPTISYKAVSSYPYIARDIAMWVPSDITWESVNSLCAQVGNSLVTRIDLFDTFSKVIDGVQKTSYAFRIVFQSYERTLTDEEVGKMMEEYYSLFREKGFIVR